MAVMSSVSLKGKVRKAFASPELLVFIAVNFIVGAIELTLELTATRIAAPYIGLTIYVWTSIIGVMLASLAAGYVIGGHLADKRKQISDIAYLLLISAIFIGLLNAFKDPLLSSLSGLSVSSQTTALLMSVLLFAPPTVALGTIPPYLTRLSISKVDTSGVSVACINAAGTLGALFGTFFTGFYLFSLVGTRNILSILVILLVITSVCMAGSRTRLRSSLVIAGCFFLLTPSSLQLSGKNRDLDTAYGRYIIRDVGVARALQSDAATWQSAIYREADVPYPTDSYINVFGNISGMPAKRNNYLVIGGGAYTVPSLLERLQPHAQITVVDVDKALVPLSEKYFALKPSSNLHLVTEDGRQYINKSHGPFNLIYMDAFSNETPPFQLTTTEAVKRLDVSLESGGVVAVNLVSAPKGPGAKYIASMEKTYMQTFKYVDLFQTDSHYSLTTPQNILLLASHQPLAPMLYSAAQQSEQLQNDIQHPLTYANNLGMVLTDNFAPVEQMVAAGN